jgi:aspartyl-tRNA(Asn)/glutamyl-tRNA(Gln) amidotransferase subunit A
VEKTDIPFLSTAELSELIRQREVSPVEVTESYLERIDALNFKFNSYLTVCRQEALQAARDAERAIAEGNYLGPMHGIPVAVKDQLWTKGIRTTIGSRLMADFFPEEDATAVANLKNAGAILLGKTNLTEFAIGGSQRYNPNRNPWDLDTFTGGSSGGSGSATAAFLCATSLGEDTGGSIRRPAAWCGLAGLRPSWGRVSRYGVMPGSWSMDQVGPISRTVEDAAITLGAIAGYDPKDPYSRDVPVPDYRRALDGDIQGIRVGAITELIHSEIVDPEVRDAIIKAGSMLGELGATVEEVSLPLTIHSGTITGTLINVESAMTHRDWIRDRLHEFGHTNQISLLTGSIMPAQAYYKAQKLRELVRRQILEAMETYDVLILPTSKTCAPRLEEDPVITSKEMAASMPPVMTRPFNLANAPALSINCGFNSQGLPIGLQIGGRPFAEETVLKVGHAYEQNTPWHNLRPPNA